MNDERAQLKPVVNQRAMVGQDERKQWTRDEDRKENRILM